MKKFCFALAIAIGLVATAARADGLPRNQQPMYGGKEKNEAMKKADEAFIADVTANGYTRETGAQEVVKVGWQYFFKGDIATAISRFNQAWLLNPENGDAYHGFALVTVQRGGSMKEAEGYFKTAISKPNVNPAAFADYARLLNLMGRFDEALAQGRQALRISEKTRNARIQISYAYMNKRDAKQACEWARLAQKSGDVIDPPNFVEIACR